MRIDQNGNVGIGTSSPASRLHVEAANTAITSAALGQTTLTLQTNSAQAANVGASIGLGGFTDSGGTQRNFGIVAGRKANGSNADTSGYLSFYTNLSGVGIGERMRIDQNGNVGIGTTTPYSRLTVWGPDSAASTSAFLVANNASTTEFAVLDNGNATLAGNLIQNSDQRLKTNIQSLDASSSLAAIEALNPVTFNWIDPARGVTPQLGFIAQQVLPVFPNLISTTSATALTPDGTLSLNYIGFIAPLVKSVQQLAQEITNLAIPLRQKS